MIITFKDRETERIWNGQHSRKHPHDIQKRALDKLAMIDAADFLEDLKNPPSNRFHELGQDRAGQHLFPLTSNGVYASSGKTEMRMMSKSQTTTDPDWLHNSHAGELVVSEFLEPLGLDCATLAKFLAIDPARLQAMLDGTTRVDGELDLRLARYFRMSEGFFLRLQDQYELREAKRALNGELEQIVPRAA